MKKLSFYTALLMTFMVLVSCNKDKDDPEPQSDKASVIITVTETSYGVKSWASADVFLYTETGSMLEKKSPSTNGSVSFVELLPGTYDFYIYGRVVKHDGGTLTFTEMIYLGSAQLAKGQSVNKTFSID